MTGLIQDVRYALRQWRKSPGFAAIAILTITLGIGANTAIFSLINAIMLRMLPVRDPQTLVILTWAARRPAHAALGEIMWSGCPASPATACSFSYPMFEQLRAEQKVFSAVSAFVPTEWGPNGMLIKVSGHPMREYGLFLSGDFFTMLGIHPALGRLLNALDDRKEAAPVVVVSYGFWQNALGSDAAVIGKYILIGKTTFTIVGITPPGFSEISARRAAKPGRLNKDQRKAAGLALTLVGGLTTIPLALGVVGKKSRISEIRSAA